MINTVISEAALLVLLNAQMSFPLFKDGSTAIKTTKLPFYKEYVLVKAKAFTTIPIVEFSFLWNSNDNNVIKMDGSRDIFFDNTEQLKPRITPRTAVAYIKFVLGYVWDENGAMRLCESIDDVDFSSTPFPNQLSELTSSIKPAVVTKQDDMIVVNCNIIYGKALYRATIELQHDGLFEIVDEEQLGEEIDALRPIFLE